VLPEAAVVLSVGMVASAIAMQMDPDGHVGNGQLHEFSGQKQTTTRPARTVT
jgi:hypothetical protein